MPFKYQQLSPAGKRLARIPRFGRLIGMLPDEQLANITSEAGLLWELYSYVADRYQDETGLIDSGLRATEASRLGLFANDLSDPQVIRFRGPIENRRWQVQLAMAMWGAIAFRLFLGESGDGQSKWMDRYVGNVDVFLRDIGNRFLIPPGSSGPYVDSIGQPLKPRWLVNDWCCLKNLNTYGLSHLILSNSLQGILFADLTTQTFFAAYWACRWGSDAEIQLIHRWLPDPHLNTNSQYAEFWQMVVDMPNVIAMCEEVARPTDRFEALLSPLYDGTLRDQNGHKIRSTELIYKSWQRMKDTDAGLVFRGEFEQILSGKDTAAEVAKGLLEYENNRTRNRESQFLSLCRRDRGEKDTSVFLMSGPAGEYPESDGETRNNPQHRVGLSDYRLHRLCVTNAAYELFETRHKSLRERGNQVENMDERPVENVCWYDAVCFARWIGERKIASERYLITLPSEAEWEYAFRSHERKFFVDWLDDDGTRIPASAWGYWRLSDTLREWCWDIFERKYDRLKIDSVANESLGTTVAIKRVLRGGRWIHDGQVYDLAIRIGTWPWFRNAGIGFRLAAVPVDRGEMI